MDHHPYYLCYKLWIRICSVRYVLLGFFAFFEVISSILLISLAPPSWRLESGSPVDVDVAWCPLPGSLAVCPLYLMSVQLGCPVRTIELEEDDDGRDLVGAGAITFFANIKSMNKPYFCKNFVEEKLGASIGNF